MQSPFSRAAAAQFNQAPNREAFFRWPKIEAGRVTDVITVECEQVCWQRPGDRQILLVRVNMGCPRCAFPFVVTPNQDVTVNVSEDGALDIPAIVRCHANWPELNGGLQTGNKQRCGWSAVIRRGWAHEITCPAARTADRVACTCGCNLTTEQFQQIRQQ